MDTIPDICEVRRFGRQPAAVDAAADLLIEIPHGATGGCHFEAIRRRLTSRLPEELREFFFANTDVGAFECAERVACTIVDAGSHPGLSALLGDAADRLPKRSAWNVLIVRSLIPRTFIDCNRRLGSDRDSPGMTPALPEYVRTEADQVTLKALYDAYQEVAARAYRLACGGGGMAIQLHTYAPRAVEVEAIDEGVVAALRRAYEPESYERWDRRPDVDIISRDDDGRLFAPPTLVAGIRRCFARAGIQATENASYRLHRSTIGHFHATTYPGRVLCLEINRERLVHAFTPFEEMTVGESKVAEMSAPLAAACLQELARREATRSPDSRCDTHPSGRDGT